MRQLHKNLLFYFFAFVLIGMAVVTYLLNESVIDLTASAEKVVFTIENPESMPERYNSKEDYIVALEEQVTFAIKRDQEIWGEEIEFLKSLFEFLIIIGIGQLVILCWPVKNEHRT